MATKLKPWSGTPFELIVHGEIHHKRKTDYDRRLALIGFDNAIEYSISTYLNLHPSQRGGAQYKITDVESWQKNFHSKLGFFLGLVADKKLPVLVSEADFIWYHNQRNDHYHSGTASVPTNAVIDGARVAAFWVFSVLFEISESELLKILNDSMSDKAESSFAIPAGYAVPEKATVNPNALAGASLIGQWDQNNDSDLDTVRRVIDEF